MTRIGKLFEDLKRDGRKGLLAYLTAGDPSPARWITGPSAMGSEKGTPNSTRSAPPRTSASTSSGVRKGDGSPAVR